MNTYYIGGIQYSVNDVYHHGIEGQKWGIRRYQNPDGTLTNEGRARYTKGDAEHELGLGNKKRLNTVEKRFRDNFRAYKRAEDKMYKKAANAKYKGKDPTKYMNKAKSFMNSAEMQKKMNMNFQKLDERERKRVNRSIVAGQYAAQYLGGVIGQSLYQNHVENMLKSRFA